MFLELAHIKKHLNIDAEYTDDDEYILYLYDVAVDVIQKHIDITFDEIMQKEGKIPNALLIIVMIVASISAAAIWALIPAFFKAKFNTNPNSLTYILNMYRDYSNANI